MPAVSGTRARVFGGAVAWNAVAMAASVLVSLAAAMVQTRGLGPTGYGHYAYMAWIAEAGGALAALGLPRPIGRFMAAFKRDGDWRAATRMASLSVLAVIASGVLLGALAVRVPRFLPAPSELLVLLVPLALAAVAAQNVIAAALQGGHGFKAAAVANLAAGAVLLSGSVVVAVRHAGFVSQFGVAALATTASVLTGGAALWAALRAGGGGGAPRPRTDWGPFAAYWKAAAALTVIEMVVWQRSELFFLQRFAAPEQAAYYAAGFAIASRLTVVPQLFAPVLLATVAGLRYREEADVMRRLFASMTRWLALLCAPLYLVLAALSLPLAHGLFGPRFASSSAPMVILLVGGLVPAIAVPGSAIVYGTDRIGFALRLGAAAAVVTLLADVLLIPGHGARSAALANLSGQLFATVATYVLSLRPSGFAVPWVGVLRAVLAAALGAAAAWAVSSATGSLVALPLGAVAGGLVYLVALRVLRVLEPADDRLFAALSELSPAFARPVIVGAGRFLLPSPGQPA